MTDALLFPLLLLDVLIITFWGVLMSELIPEDVNVPAITLSLLVSIPMCAVIDFLIVRAAWRKAASE